MSTVLAWHFVGATLRDGRPVPPDGEWLVHDGEVVPRSSGLHASERLIDALEYARGSTICRVKLRGDLKREDDKLAGRERRILWRVDGERLLREFARKCALDVIHLWDAPNVVRRYLETGDESIRQSAMKAARTVARTAAEAAVWAADNTGNAENAARAAAWDAAEAAAWDAARAAAEATAEATARKSQNTRLTEMVKAARKKEGA